MTTPDDPVQRREIPKIKGEEDISFSGLHIESGEKKQPSDNLSETDDLNKEITRFRYQTGRRVLYIAMAAMGISVVLDMIASYIPGVESELLTNAFEAFKLITMTVLGYIFGSNGSK